MSDQVILIGIVALLGCSGAMVAWLAKEKGRDPFPWFFLGALFNIFAALIVGLAPDGPEEKPVQVPYRDVRPPK